MKNLLKYLSLLISCSLLFCGYRDPAGTQSNTSEKIFDLKVIQNGVELPIVDHKVQIKKSSFQFKFIFSKPGGVGLIASARDRIYKKVSEGTPITRLDCFENDRGAAEGLHNDGHSMIVQEEGFNYWYYDSDSDNRFDIITKMPGRLECTRTTDSLAIFPKSSGMKRDYKLPSGEDIITVPMSKVVENKLYLVFMCWDTNWDTGVNIEQQRDWLEIDLVD
jgi:hypothetical protein